MNGFEKLVRILEKHYYGDLIMPFFELVAIITGLLFVRKDKTGVLFLAYLIFDFLVLLVDCYIELSYNTSVKISSFIFLTNTLVSLVELLVYYYFFFKIIHSSIVIKLMKVLVTVFFSIVVIFITTEFNFLTPRYSYVSNIIGVIEFVFLLLPCTVYFYELLKNDPIVNLYQRPSFWIVTGIFFYAVISVPYYLIDRFFVNNHNQYRSVLDLALFYIPFTVNFVFLTRAFLCKKTLTI
jgi:hypothetical protein